MTLSGRATAILERYPAHLAATDPGKVLGTVVDRMAAELDVEAVQLRGVRRAHRLGEAAEVRDLLLLAGLHGIRASDLELLLARLDAVGAAGAPLLANPRDAGAAADARASLAHLLNLPAGAFDPQPGEDDAAADLRLGHALRKLVLHAAELEELRARIGGLITIHIFGNGSTETLLRASALHLGLEVTALSRHADGYWHFAHCRDRMRVVEHRTAEDPPVSVEVEPHPDIVAIEENPFETTDLDPSPRRHGDRFQITRKGWEEVPVAVKVVGVADRTVGPMVVNLDSGAGVVFSGTVPDGDELDFDPAGTVSLAGADVTRRCYSFAGAVFASTKDTHRRDFVFGDAADPAKYGDRAATFAVPHPYEDAFAGTAAFPHPGGALQPPTLLAGVTRWAFFVRAGHFGTGGPPADEAPTPSFASGVWDQSVLDPTGGDPSAKVGFEWTERKPYALCVWIPQRFEALDGGRGASPTVRERLRLLLDRYRPAGVHVCVRSADAAWTLGVGIARDMGSTEPLGTVLAGTALTAEEAET